MITDTQLRSPLRQEGAIMNQLDSLRRYTTLVADTGDFETIAAYKPQDATTNPSLLFQAAQKPQYQHLVDRAAQEAAEWPGAEAARAKLFMDKLLISFG
jgi:transaldolase